MVRGVPTVESPTVEKCVARKDRSCPRPCGTTPWRVVAAPRPATSEQRPDVPPCSPPARAHCLRRPPSPSTMNRCQSAPTARAATTSMTSREPRPAALDAFPREATPCREILRPVARDCGRRAHRPPTTLRPICHPHIASGTLTLSGFRGGSEPDALLGVVLARLPAGWALGACSDVSADLGSGASSPAGGRGRQPHLDWHSLRPSAKNLSGRFAQEGGRFAQEGGGHAGGQASCCPAGHR